MEAAFWAVAGMEVVFSAAMVTMAVVMMEAITAGID